MSNDLFGFSFFMLEWINLGEKEGKIGTERERKKLRAKYFYFAKENSQVRQFEIKSWKSKWNWEFDAKLQNKITPLSKVLKPTRNWFKTILYTCNSKSIITCLIWWKILLLKLKWVEHTNFTWAWFEMNEFATTRFSSGGRINAWLHTR